MQDLNLGGLIDMILFSRVEQLAKLSLWCFIVNLLIYFKLTLPMICTSSSSSYYYYYYELVLVNICRLIFLVVLLVWAYKLVLI